MLQTEMRDKKLERKKEREKERERERERERQRGREREGGVTVCGKGGGWAWGLWVTPLAVL